jgi:DTW domain-containing protein YfiP
VVVVMHCFEAQRSTNTGRLAVRMLEGAHVRLRGELDAPVETPLPGRRMVLFPLEHARPLVPEDARDGPVTLVVPDGSWSQARRIARRDPFAVGAQAVSIPAGVATSAYGLRRSDRAGALCTMEAIAIAMGILEGERVGSALRAGFEAWRAGAEAVRAGR